MERGKRIRLALLGGLLVSAGALAVLLTETNDVVRNIANIFSPNESDFQNQTHFLVFFGGKPGENATTANAYYKAIDPNNSKPTFQDWLVNAGFIQDKSEWHPSGAQLIACDLPGCDLPKFTNGSLTHGDNVINTDSHAIVLNAADLGFVRNQFIRCVPSCDASNPKIYTYLENYPVNPFARTSKFPAKSGYPTQAEATAAINSALNRPLGNLPGCDASTSETALGCSIQRIADVAFEWAPPATNPSSSTRFGQLYAYIFNSPDSNGNTTETIAFGVNGKTTPDIAAHTLTPVGAGDPFPPNLDFLGFKQHPGVCFVCHGGYPQKLTSTGAYPRQGNVNEFRFLPLDMRNLLFTSLSGPDQPALPVSNAFTDQANQEAHIKQYNKAVLKTVTTARETDDQGVRRVAHLRETIIGWYAATPGDQTMSRSTQNSDFVPAGWAGSEQLYLSVVGPSCRSCHFNRELSLDFGTVANFDSKGQGLLDLVLTPFCQSRNPDRGGRPMALAHLTYQRFWEAQANPTTLPDGFVISNTADQLAQHFGFSGVAGYCASHR